MMKIKGSQTAYFLIGCLALCLLAGCSSGDLGSFKPQDSCWNSQQSILFELDLAENETFPADVFIALTDEYSFSNMYLKLSWRSPDGKTDFIRFSENFIDPIGNWQVEKSGSIYLIPFQSFSQLQFAQGGLYQFELTHDMRKELLCGVKRVEVNSAR